MALLSTQSRPLGEQERLLNYLHGFGGLIVLQALHLRGGVDPKMLEKALVWLQKRHPMARAHIRYGALVFRKYPPFVYRQPHFETARTGKIPLRVVKADWREVLADELAKPLRRGRRPRLRLTLVSNTKTGSDHLLVCADHACIDAQSCNMLTREILAYLADPVAMEATEFTPEQLPPPLELGLTQKPAKNASPYQPAIRLPAKKPPRNRPVTNVINKTIAPEQLAALKAAALTNRTSLHGALGAAFLLAIRDKYGLDEMTCLSTVDMRRMCKPALPAETFGCYIDILRTRHKLVDDYWAMAKDLSFRIISTLARDQQAASLLKIPDWELYAKESVPTMRSGRRIDGLAITTAGDSGLEQVYGHLTLEDVSMAVSLDTFGPYIMVIACERRGAMDLSICFASRAFLSADAEDLTSRALGHLMDNAPIDQTNGKTDG